MSPATPHDPSWRPDKPNVILICVDQWRGDCLSVDGRPVVHTPNLDTMSAFGVRFRHAYSAVPSCIAARAALFTGLSQRNHGRVGYEDWVTWNYPVTIAGEFTRHGYQTQAVGKMHVWPERSQTGFQNVILHDGYLVSERRRDMSMEQVDDYLHWLREKTGDPKADYCDHGVACNANNARPWDKDERLHPTSWVTEQGIDFLRRRDPRKPFFLYLSYYHPHPPYTPPAWAFEQYLYQDMPEVPVGEWAGKYDKKCGWLGSQFIPETYTARLPAPLLKRARAGYYGLITHIDLQIQRMMEALSGHGLANDTIVCFVSDHGEMLGDHHLFRKTWAYEGSARIPFILQGPGRLELHAGSVVDAPVELRDVMPTLLDAAGLPVPEGLDGRSVLPLARGESPEACGWRDALHGEHTSFGGAMHYVTDGREKYIWMSGEGDEQLFDLVADPHELHDLAPERRERVAQWRRVLARELAGREEGFSDGENLIPGRPVKATLSHILK